MIAIRKMGLYRLDLRSKRFAALRQTVANGKKTLEFAKRVDAEARADEIEKLLTEFGTRKLETLEAVMRIDPLAIQARLEPYGTTLTEAVDFYVAHLEAEKRIAASQTFGKVIEEWLAYQKRRVEQKTLRPASYETLFYKCRGYKAQWNDRPVASITPNEIESWLEGLKVEVAANTYAAASQVSKKHQLSCLSQLFLWAKRRQFVSDNPCETLKVERNEDAGGVGYFMPEAAEEIMRLSLTKRFRCLLPFHAICMFSGVRVSECRRLSWENIDFTDKTIIVPALSAKTEGRRAAMRENLCRWLTWFHSKYSTHPLTPAKFQHKNRAFRKALAVECWPPNGMRHSYASYFLGAKFGSYADLEEYCGNSRVMLRRHYLSYPDKETSVRFWAITPETLLAEESSQDE